AHRGRPPGGWPGRPDDRSEPLTPARRAARHQQKPRGCSIGEAAVVYAGLAPLLRLMRGAGGSRSFGVEWKGMTDAGTERPDNALAVAGGARHGAHEPLPALPELLRRRAVGRAPARRGAAVDGQLRPRAGPQGGQLSDAAPGDV